MYSAAFARFSGVNAPGRSERTAGVPATRSVAGPVSTQPDSVSALAGRAHEREASHERSLDRRAGREQRAQDARLVERVPGVRHQQPLRVGQHVPHALQVLRGQDPAPGKARALGWVAVGALLIYPETEWMKAIDLGRFAG